MNESITITPTQAGQRLDRVLPDVVGRTRSQAQKMIKAGEVTLNGKMVTPHYAVKEGDVVAWRFEDHAIAVTANATLDIPILFEDDEIVVIEKPIGVVAHQGTGHSASDTVANWFLAKYPKAKDVGGDSLRPGIVHRLDRDVSGVMVLAKTQTMYDELVDRFSRSVVQKEYTAIVYGRMDQPHGVINFPLVRSTSKAKMAAKPSSDQRAKDDERGDDERDAITEFETTDARQHYSVVKAMPKTGRMHQIRAHMAAIDHAIVGDTLYAPKNLHPDREERLFLHATRLIISDDRPAFESPLPTSFALFLATHL